MPTTRPRHVITESDEVKLALDAAAARWPEDAGSRSRLLLRLVREGHEHLEAVEQSALEARLAALLAHHGQLTGMFPQGYLTELRDDWPA
jgi:hypothetical protein